jgi:BTB/POZ domain
LNGSDWLCLIFVRFVSDLCYKILFQVTHINSFSILFPARSPVFAAMFEHEMEERKQNRVAITDVDHEVLKEMLRFIYTGKAPNLDKMADDLLAAADKVSHLLLNIRLSTINWLSTLFYVTVRSGKAESDVRGGAMRKLVRGNSRRNPNPSRSAQCGSVESTNDRFYQYVSFKGFRIQSIRSILTVLFCSNRSHATDVMETVGWKNMVTTHPHLINEAFRALATQQIPPIGPPRKRVKMSWGLSLAATQTPTLLSFLTTTTTTTTNSNRLTPPTITKRNSSLKSQQQPPHLLNRSTPLLSSSTDSTQVYILVSCKFV